ncbi:MAG TPA: PAS domain S-box protein [Cytophagaceae bacterium]
MENDNKDFQINQFKNKLEVFEKKFYTVAQTATDAIIIINEGNEIIFFNKSAERIFGYEESELEGKDLTMLMPERHRQGHNKGMARFISSGIPKLIGHTVEIEGLRKNGSEFPMELSLSCWQEDSQYFFTSIIRDVTKRKKEIKQLEMLSAITEAINAAADFNAALKIIIQKVCQELGWDFGEAWLPDGSKDKIFFAPVWYASEERLLDLVHESENLILSKGEGMPGRVFEGKIEWSHQLGENERYFSRYKSAKKLQLKTGLGVPITSDGIILAAILFYKFETEEVDEQQKNIVVSIASQLGTALRKKQSEDQLREREHFIKKVADSSPIVIQVYDRINFKSLYSNKELVNILEYEAEELSSMGKDISQIVHPEDLPKLAERNDALAHAEDGEIVESEMRVRHAKGGWRWLFTKTTVFKRLADGTVSETLSISIDITEKKNAEERLKSTQKELLKLNNHLEEKVNERTAELEIKANDFKFLADAMPQIVYTSDAEGKLLYINQQWIDYTGMPAEETKKNWFKPIFPDDVAKLADGFQKSKESGNGLEIEYRIRRLDGLYRWNLGRIIPMKNEAGRITSWIGTATDIHERKQFEETLSESEARFRAIADEAPAFIFIAGANANVEFLNKTWLDFSGMTEEQAMGRTSVDISHPDDRDIIMKTYDYAYKHREPYSFEIRQKGKDGNYRWILWKGIPRYLKGSFIGMMGIGVDIHERKHAEQALIESEEKFRAMADNISQLAWMADGEGFIFWYNQRWYDYTGTTIDLVKGYGWEKVHHENHVQRVVDFVKEAWVKGDPWQLEFPLRRHDGAWHWFLTRAVPIKDHEGNIVRWFGTNTDIQEQKIAIEGLGKAKQQLQVMNYELSNKNEELRKTNNDLDSFIYTASHDLKSPISNIEGLITALPETLSEEIRNREDYVSIMQMIQHSINRFKNTIEELADVTKVQKNIAEDEVDIDVCKVIEDVKDGLSTEIALNRATVNLDFNACQIIHYSKRNFRSIIYNLVSNAIKYKAHDRDPIINIRTANSEGYIILTVEDNGLGVEESKIPQMFRMFKRLHDHVEGSGIGLYIVKRMIENNGGRIKVKSEVGKGTTFDVYFKA